MATPEHIGIIGGGYTGLTCAYYLTKAGYKVSILERGGEVGGLAADFKIQGEHLEKAYHHLFRTDVDIIELANELGIGDALEWRPSSLALYYGGVLYPFMTPFDLLKFSPLTFLNRIRAGLVVLFLQKTSRWRRFAKQTAYSWMLKWSGKQVVQVIWEPLLKGKFDKYYNKVSMAWLWARVHTRANSRQAGDFGEKLGYFSRGFHLFTQALVKEISSRGGTIITDVAVETIKRNPKNNVIEVETPKKKYSFDKVVATVPTHVFSKLIEGNPEVTPKYLKQLDSIDYLGAALLIFSSKQSLSKYYWHNINDLAAPFLVFIQHTNLIPAQRYNNYNIYYVGAYIPHKHIYFDMHEQDLKNVWYDYLREMFPDFDRAEIKDEHMFRLRNAQHIVDTNYESKIPAYTSPVAGVYLSNFSQIFPEDRGTNYAVREGKKLAAMLIEKENANS